MQIRNPSVSKVKHAVTKRNIKLHVILWYFVYNKCSYINLCSICPSHTQQTTSKQLTASVQFSSVAQSCPTLRDPMNRSTPGLPVHHQLPEFTQTHVHRVSDAIQPSHPLSSPSPPNLQSLPASGSFQMSKFFISGSQSIGISPSTSVLPMNIQDWFPIGWSGWISLLSKRCSTAFSNTTVQKHQLFSTQQIRLAL